MKTVPAANLVNLTAAIMQAGGSHPEEARTIARRLVDSNLVGHDSHGVLRVGKYLEWVREGWLKPNTPPTIVFDSDTIAIIDGLRAKRNQAPAPETPQDPSVNRQAGY